MRMRSKNGQKRSLQRLAKRRAASVRCNAFAIAIFSSLYIFTCTARYLEQVGLPAVDHAVAVPQPPEAWHLVARRSTVEVNDDVIVGDQELKTADDVANIDNVTNIES